MTTTTRLADLRSQLASLQRRRRLVRWGLAWSAPIVGIVATLLVLFALDVAFELTVLQRLLLMAQCFVLLAFAWQKYSAPFFNIRESLEQMAIEVGRRQGIDSDLVAALQFESPDATDWGSPRLEAAVVDQVAELGRRVNVFEGFSIDRLRRRAVWAAGAMIVLLAVWALFPRHAAVFARRLLLADLHYPTDTTIELVTINADTVLTGPTGGMTPREIRLAQGRELVFGVRCSGDLPPSGEVQLESTQTGRRRTIKLRRLAPPYPPNAQARDALYEARLPRFVDPLEYKLAIGDATTDSARILMTSLPVVETRLAATPPSYARRARREQTPAGARQISVLEGSRVDIALACLNEKRLKKAWLIARYGKKTQKLKLQPNDRRPGEWIMSSARSPFARVTQEIRFEAVVADEDGLAPASPISGTIRLRADRPPHGSASVVHQVVLPTARPVVSYQVLDDFGIGEVTLHAEVERVEQSSAPAASDRRFIVRSAKQRLLADKLPFRGEYAVDLSTIPLKKGDRVALTLEAADYRGEATGVIFRGDPIVLEISDESGVLAAISAADERSEQQLSDIIKQQLGIGESP